MPQHLIAEEREVISQMRFANHSPSEIAKTLNRHRSTISRELARNSSGDEYCGVVAQRKSEQRRRERPRITKLQSAEAQEYVTSRLKKYWSPDQIAGRSQRDFPRNPRRQLSRTTIYAWLYADDHTECWQRYLRSWMWKKPSRRGQIPNATAIKDRPAAVARRKRYGDWEGDTIVGSRQQGGLLSLVERKSGYTYLVRLEQRQAQPVAQAACRRLKSLPANLRRTVTFDNGKEFAAHETISRRLGMDVYFAYPHCPWQRGTNENTNGLARQFFPKKSSIKDYSDHDISRFETLLNERPRRRLGYRTPSETLHRFGVAIES